MSKVFIKNIPDSRFITNKASLSADIWELDTILVGLEQNFFANHLVIYTISNKDALMHNCTWDFEHRRWKFPPLDYRIADLVKKHFPAMFSQDSLSQKALELFGDGKITIGALSKLAAIAQLDFEGLCYRHPRYKKMLPLAICLAQGAATHVVDGVNGIKDFDVWYFFKAGEVTAPPRRVAKADFGRGKYGKTNDSPNFVGRRVDLMMRSIPYDLSPILSIQNYLVKKNTRSAEFLSMKGVIILESFGEESTGTVIWRGWSYRGE